MICRLFEYASRRRSTQHECPRSRSSRKDGHASSENRPSFVFFSPGGPQWPRWCLPPWVKACLYSVLTADLSLRHLTGIPRSDAVPAPQRPSRCPWLCVSWPSVVVPFWTLQSDADPLCPAWWSPARAEVDGPGFARSHPDHVLSTFQRLVLPSPVLPALRIYTFKKVSSVQLQRVLGVEQY